jgi:hypothetical protein
VTLPTVCTASMLLLRHYLGIDNTRLLCDVLLQIIGMFYCHMYAWRVRICCYCCINSNSRAFFVFVLLFCIGMYVLV